ncbi:peptidoglycan-binding protein [Streptomyces sp. NPDC014995]|uniref:peptidoglycan-binding protein n=1 Tax=Streptomyces sp. NPDC014995 TaxID=3364936 RepID=UPI0036F68317
MTLRTTRTTRTRLGVALVAAAAAGALAVSASPASANASDGYVSGAGSFYDDFGDEGTLSTSSHSSSNATCLWQIILLAEGANESDGSDYDAADIDGEFGPNTKVATQSLQRTWGLGVDGIVGTQTFGAADEQWNSSTGAGELEHVSTGTTADTKYKLRYHGSKYYFDFYRTESGRYRFYHNGAWHYASYSSNTCS